MKKLVDWSSPLVTPGQRFGRLIVLSTHKIEGTYRYMAKCQCDCGSEPICVRIDNLVGKRKTRSCGCLQKETATKHGAWGHPLFNVWTNMMRRCSNPKDQRYARYGGRGITVCERWHDVNAFIEDMYPSFQKGLKIDRIDNDKGYYKENCHWVNQSAQNRNYSRNILLTYEGKTLCLVDWSHLTGISYGTLWERVKVLNWTTERTLTTPPIPISESVRTALNVRWKKPNKIK